MKRAVALAKLRPHLPIAQTERTHGLPRYSIPNIGCEFRRAPGASPASITHCQPASLGGAGILPDSWKTAFFAHKARSGAARNFFAASTRLA